MRESLDADQVIFLCLENIYCTKDIETGLNKSY